MDQKRIEKIDIERCKELFEYEMTEVILMLKGEFAAVSGKDLGLSQHHISEEKRNAPKEAISHTHIPTIDAQLMEVSNELAEKLASPVGSIFGKNSADRDESQHAAIKLDIPLPTRKSFKCPNTFTLLQVDAPRQFDIPHPPRVQLPQSTLVNYTIPQITVPLIQDAPRINVHKVSASCEYANVPLVPHFRVGVPKMDSEPIAVEVPNVESFAQMGHQTKHNIASSTILESMAHTSKKIAIPEVPALFIPVVEISRKSISVPKVRKISAPNLLQAPVKNSASDTIPAIIADSRKICTSLSSMDFSGIAKGKARAEIKTAVNSFVPVKRIPISPAFAVIDLPQQPLEVPDIHRLGSLQSITVDDVSDHSGITIPAMPDLQKELDDMLSTAAR